jgi:uncharacterized Zn-finger protein
MPAGDTPSPEITPSSETTASTPTAITPTEIIHVDQRVVACDGGGGPLGHPRVYLRIPDHEVMCPYCSRLFVVNEGVAPADGH